MIKNGVYAAGLSILNSDKSLNIKSTIDHAESAIKSGLHGVFFLDRRDKVSCYLSRRKRNLFLKHLLVNSRINSTLEQELTL